MTKKEFEDRTGYIVPDDRFKEIETMYLEAGDCKRSVPSGDRCNRGYPCI